jgi:ABC-2 type transport system ATP-binding protein
MITAENIVKIYQGNVKALDGISFNVEKGEVCGYLGANGAGKSTTIKILCGMLLPTSGSAIINGIDVLAHPDKVKKLIGYVPESGALFLSLTPYDFLEFVCRMYDIGKDIYDHRIYSFMEMFDLKNEVRTPMHEFSKGMRQKVLLISSLIHDPDIIFWDEPLGGIDYSTTLTVRNLVKELSQAGKTFFYSTHLIESADKICTKIIILNSGKTVYEEAVDPISGTDMEGLMKKYILTEGPGNKIAGLYNKISAAKE